MSHTLVDALLATAIIVVWQRSYGAEETGWMTALLRVFGFVPAVIHMAWAQVKLSQANQDLNDKQEWTLGIIGCLCIFSLIALCYLAIHQSWLSPQWSGVLNYVWPVAAWQCASCLAAAFSHRPFQTNTETHFSWACIGVALLQAFALLAPLTLIDAWHKTDHLKLFATFSTTGLLVLSFWMASLKTKH